MAEIYDTTQQNISSHLLNIYADGELDKDATHKKFLLVRHEGSRDVRLNLLVSQFLDYAEFQAMEQNPMTMSDWISALDSQIVSLKRNLLEGSGRISHQEAMEKAEQEFQIYREREMKLLESDYDRLFGLLND